MDDGDGIPDQRPSATPNFAPLPSLKRERRPFSWRRLFTILGVILSALALVAVGVGALTVILTQRPQVAFLSARATETAAVSHANQFGPPQSRILALSMDSASDGWVVEFGNAKGPAVLHIVNGAAHFQVILPVTNYGPPVLQALSSTDVWLLFTQGQSIFYHYDGHAWTPVTLPSPSDAAGSVALAQFFMRSPADGWAIGTYAVTGESSQKVAFYHYDGSAWRGEPADPSASTGSVTNVPNGSQSYGTITGISAAPGGDVWATGYLLTQDQNGNTTGVSGFIYHRSNGIWYATKLANQELYGIAMTGPSSGWIIGANDKITQFGSDPIIYETNQTPMALRWNGARWAPTTIPTPDQAQVGLRLLTVAAASPTDVWIDGSPNSSSFTANSDLASDLDYLIHYDGAHWTRVSLPPVAALNPNHDATTFNTASFPNIAPAGAGGLWVAGGLTVQQGQTGSYRPLLYSYLGGQWTNIPLPG